ncbi:hypothetical protein CYLTODRAFT_423093 [Cylindrobasidium torrendii FP15055 ss-10]|uniref:Uncharacterized protein n=1 Tax=Cylindrobasidium torrendii FP15055 ss-10 TaxID=1314674 RepID=A0A0D7B8M6_9AGAR|nr:hypothetical protein CYLTODRAFT_423093 [Cylindrobasidium torrendii FP15055 ss-10]
MSADTQAHSRNDNPHSNIALAPRDILITIFSYIVYAPIPNPYPEQAPIANSFDTPAWQLGQVCRYWRHISQTSPVLWSRLRLDFNESRTTPGALLRRAQELLEHSGASLVTVEINISLYCSEALGEGVARLIRDVAERIRTLWFEYRFSADTPDQQPETTRFLPFLQSPVFKDCTFSRLETLVLWPFNLSGRSKCRFDIEGHLRVDAFARCPSLRHVELRDDTLQVEFVLPYESLSVIRANAGSMNGVIHQLQQATHVDLDFRVAAHIPMPGCPQIPWHPSVLRKMTYLRVRCDNIHSSDPLRRGEWITEHTTVFTSLHTSTLRTLHIAIMTIPGLRHYVSLMPDAALGGLQELVVDCSRIVQGDPPDPLAVRYVLEKLPSLRTLRIGADFGDGALRAMIKDTSLLPKLTVLKVDVMLVFKHCGLITAFVRKRGDMLQSIQVTAWLQGMYFWRNSPYSDVTDFATDIMASKARDRWLKLCSLVHVDIKCPYDGEQTDPFFITMGLSQARTDLT